MKLFFLAPLLLLFACTSSSKPAEVVMKQGPSDERQEEQPVPALFKQLLNKELRGLTIVNEAEKDPYKRFGIDLGAECYSCTACSFNITRDSIEIINGCGEEITGRFAFALTDISESKGKLYLRGKQHSCVIEPVAEKIWSVSFTGMLAKTLTVNSYFTFDAEIEQFEVKDCEGFEG